MPACKNLVVQVKIQAGLWHFLHTWWYVWVISVSACGEGDCCHHCVQLWHVQFTVFIFLSKVKIMTFIRMKPWLSNRMKIVIVHGSLSYRLLFSGIVTYMHYASAFTNHVTITLWEGVVRSVQCCLWSPISCVCVQEQGCRTSAPFFITASLH